MDWMDYFDHAFGLIVVIPLMIYLLNRYFPAIMDEEVDFITLLIKDFEKFDFSFYQHNDKYFGRYTREKNRKLTSESEIYVHNCWNYKEQAMISILFSFKKDERKYYVKLIKDKDSKLAKVKKIIEHESGIMDERTIYNINSANTLKEPKSILNTINCFVNRYTILSLDVLLVLYIFIFPIFIKLEWFTSLIIVILNLPYFFLFSLISVICISPLIKHNKRLSFK